MIRLAAPLWLALVGAGVVAAVVEAVGVHPALVGPADLGVDEGLVGLPERDARGPAEGHAEERDLVLDDRVLTHLDRQLGHEAELQLGGRDARQVPGVGEEGEDVLARERQDLGASKLVGDQRGASLTAWKRASASSPSPFRSPTRSRALIPAASSTAISSPTTSCWPKDAAEATS